MLAAFIELLAQAPVEEAHKTAAEEGRDIILAMLVVGLIFVGVDAPRRPVPARRPQAAQQLGPLDPRELSAHDSGRMRPDLPTGTVTLVFTDVEGSTRLLHELGAASYAEALAQHRALIRQACLAEGGVEVDTQGDAFFFAFPTAPGATAAVAAFTRALAEGPDPRTGRPAHGLTPGH